VKPHQKGSLHHKFGMFGSVPLILLQALRVFIALASFEGIKTGSYPGVDAIAKRAGIARSSVSGATKLLAESGWLQKTRLGQGQSNRYTLLCFSEPVADFRAVKHERRQPREQSGKFQKSVATDDKKSVSDGRLEIRGHGIDYKTTLKDHGEKAPLAPPMGEGAFDSAPLRSRNDIEPLFASGEDGQTPGKAMPGLETGE
jgi:hypothetical protein